MTQMNESWNLDVPVRGLGMPGLGVTPRRTTSMVALFTAVAALAASSTAVVLTLHGASDKPAAIEPAAAAPVMVAAPAPMARGELTLEVEPPDATVEIDGVAVPGPSPFIAAGLGVGPHEVRVSHDGHVAWTRRVNVPDHQLHLPITLATEPSEGVEDEAEDASERADTNEHTGGLDKSVIRRIVRAHITEVRACYNEGLSLDASLSGRVLVRFSIAPSGDVADAVVAESSLKDDAVTSCITKAVRRWTFPKHDGDRNVVVTYPFVLEPG